MKFLLADRTAIQMEDTEVIEFLKEPYILRLGVLDYRDGFPLVHHVWYHYEGGTFFIATDSTGVKAKSLRKNSTAYFVIDIASGSSSPMGVRGRGTAKVIDDIEYATKVTAHNITRYLGSLEGPAANKIMAMAKYSSVIELTPTYIASWKF